MISAKIIADSVSLAGARLTTFELQYPRFIHSEVMTHRVFSRNAMSSRAIPVAKMIEQVRTNPAMPIHWGANQTGMQAREEIQHVGAAKDLWNLAARQAADVAQKMTELGLHKQVANRILEPFQWMRSIITATEWDNFFALRDHADADPNLEALAKVMRPAMANSEPMLRDYGWHLPYVTALERQHIDPDVLPKLSAARCARVSYLTHDGSSPQIHKDLELFDRLVGSVPRHASPIEHQAAPADSADHRSNNFVGWIQYRETFEKETHAQA